MRTRRGGSPLAARGVARVSALTVILAVAAIAIFEFLLEGIGEPKTPVHIPWIGIATLFFLSEAYVVHFQLRRDAHSFSLNEIPLVIGLFFLSPGQLVLAQVTGAALALLKRGQSPLKLMFNLTDLALNATVAAL